MLKEQEKCYKVVMKVDGGESVYLKGMHTYTQARYQCLKTVEKLNQSTGKSKEVFRETSRDFWCSVNGWVTMTDEYYIKNVLEAYN